MLMFDLVSTAVEPPPVSPVIQSTAARRVTDTPPPYTSVDASVASPSIPGPPPPYTATSQLGPLRWATKFAASGRQVVAANDRPAGPLRHSCDRCLFTNARCDGNADGCLECANVRKDPVACKYSHWWIDLTHRSCDVRKTCTTARDCRVVVHLTALAKPSKNLRSRCLTPGNLHCYHPRR